MINSKSEIYEKWTDFRPIVPIREWEGSDFFCLKFFIAYAYDLLNLLNTAYQVSTY